MDLEELRAFLQVAESGSFLAAADSLQISRTTLRRRVGALEARAGVSLLESTQQGVVLTEAGRALARRGRALQEEAGALLTSIREAGQAPSGVLRVALPVGIPPQLLTLVYGRLRAAYPKLSFEAVISSDPVSEQLVGFDMAMHFGDTTPRGKWVSHPIFRIEEGLVASRDYLARRGTPRSLDDLAGHDLLTWHPPGEDPRVMPLRGGEAHRCDPVLTSPDIYFIRHCAVAGLGICLAPAPVIGDPDFDQGALVAVLPEIVARTLTFRLTVPEALVELPKVKAVLDGAKAFIAER